MGKIRGAYAAQERMHDFPTRIVPDPGEAPKSKPPEYYLEAILTQLHNRVRDLALTIDDRTRPVDEYQVASTEAPIATSEVIAQAQFDQITERITSILVTGPPSTAFTLQVGDRYWELLTNASGFVLIGPVSMFLERTDNRILTSATAGNWTLELMGWADARY